MTPCSPRPDRPESADRPAPQGAPAQPPLHGDGDIDTIDWRPIVNDPPGPTADQMVAKVLNNAQGGSIVLMHLGGDETFEALPRIVAGLQAAGFDLVTLDELL